MEKEYHEGGFTLPGEAGYEKLTLELAEKWGADVIRDSDGTKLSPEILNAGRKIYSTICIIREHNAFAQAHPDSQQQCFLISEAVVAEKSEVAIPLLKGYFDEQFEINDSPEALAFWQVWDRTADRLVPASAWRYENGVITVTGCEKWHRYTASFLCWRVWEEINMYNHTTNSWTSEHLRQLDPRHPLAWAYLKDWLKNWCEANPHTDVIRLTSLFYNFVWIFGDDMRRRSRFVDWASYDFTVSPAALKAFEAEYGYALTAEDFINKGLLQATHRPPTKAKRDWMDFTQRFVAEKARQLVEIIHRYGKQAYVFYDDSWVGMEPYGKYFASIGFDGLIKCVFSGFECRLCAGAPAPVHELRFHPYLFPVGLGGLPTFSEGGHPERDALAYWLHVRRALARQCVDRIGLGGYLHLTLGFPAFNDAIEEMAVEFRKLKALHAHGAPACLNVRVAVLHTWGSLRSWTLSGHFHETDANVLIHVNEALSGLPVQVKFISFDDVKAGALKDVDVLINAGRMGDAWSGGDVWKDASLVSEVTRFVYEGGSLIGVGEPSACEGGDTLLRLAHILGVDEDVGQYACHAPWAFEAAPSPFPVRAEALPARPGVRLTGPDTQVLCEKDGAPAFTLHRFGKGRAAYLSGFEYSPAAARMLMDLIAFLTGADRRAAGVSDHPMVECAWFPNDGTLVVFNNADEPVEATITCPKGDVAVSLRPLETRIMKL
ncbi:MAG: 1,3-beta-galactosyl-N-acetylhexosamine phosphorylase [Clostridia bacterium]|nr:1,3-beta-galactosyl-N-acetylhexosamine phosphorylase [Clostridia bacterium]